MEKAGTGVRLSGSELVKKVNDAIDSLDADDLCVVAENAIGGKVWHMPGDDGKEYTWQPESQEQPYQQTEERLSMSKLKILTRMQMERYVKERFGHCPFCDSENITGGLFQSDGGTTYQTVTCEHCGMSWDDVYELSYLDPGKYGEWKLEGMLDERDKDEDRAYDEFLEAYNRWLDAMGGDDFEGDDETRQWFDQGMTVSEGKARLLQRWIKGLSSCLPSDDDLQSMGDNDSVSGTALTAMQARLLRHLLAPLKANPNE